MSLPYSMHALAHITQFSSAEFAVRPFIQNYPEQMHHSVINLDYKVKMNMFAVWLLKVVDLVYLGHMALPEFKKDPTFIFLF